MPELRQAKREIKGGSCAGPAFGGPPGQSLIGPDYPNGQKRFSLPLWGKAKVGGGLLAGFKRTRQGLDCGIRVKGQEQQTMHDATKVLARFAARPWAALTTADMAAGMAVPSMLSHEESQLYHWLGRSVQGLGATVDLGAFAGGSAARLLSGLALSGQRHHLFAYDHFRSSAAVWAKHLTGFPVPATDDNDILPIARQHLAPSAAQVTLCPGDIAASRWTGGPIEILAVDAAKGSAIADHIAAEFFPALVPGQSILIQQDYLMPAQPWLPAQMVMLADHFLPLARVAKDCVTFLCLSVPDAETLDAARTDVLTDGQLMQRVRAAAKWHDGMIPRDRFKAMLDKVREHPGVRLAWQMRRDPGR